MPRVRMTNMRIGRSQEACRRVRATGWEGSGEEGSVLMVAVLKCNELSTRIAAEAFASASESEIVGSTRPSDSRSDTDNPFVGEQSESKLPWIDRREPTCAVAICGDCTSDRSSGLMASWKMVHLAMPFQSLLTSMGPMLAIFTCCITTAGFRRRLRTVSAIGRKAVACIADVAGSVILLCGVLLPPLGEGRAGERPALAGVAAAEGHFRGCRLVRPAPSVPS